MGSKVLGTIWEVGLSKGMVMGLRGSTKSSKASIIVACKL